jgi:hypothetical protein
MLKIKLTPIYRHWLLESDSVSVHRLLFIEYGAIIVLLLGVTWLGARGLNADALWFDEVWSLYYSGGQEYGPISPLEVVSRVVGELEHEKNPPGYYVLLNIWGGAVGWTEAAGRVLSLLVGVLAVAWMYRAGCDIGGSRLTGLAAATAVGGSAFFIYYTHELRVYSMMVLFSACVTTIYWRLLRQMRPPRIMIQLGFVLGIAGALYMHYLTVLVIGAIGIYHLLFAPKMGQWVRITVLGLIGGGLFLPWMPILLRATSGAAALQTVAMGTPDMVRELFVVFSNASLALLVVCAVYALRARGHHTQFVWAIGALGVGLAAGLNTVYPVITHIRYLIALWPLLALVVGLGVEELARKGIAPTLVLGLWLAAGVWNTIDPGFNRVLSDETLPWRVFRGELIQHGDPDDVVIFHAADFNWFRDLEMQHYMYGLPTRYSLMENIPGLQANDEYYRNAQLFIGDAPRVWVGVDRTLTANFRLGEFQRVLDESYAPCYSAFNEPDMSMDLYVRRPDSVERMPLRFENGIGGQLLELMMAEGEVSILMGWQVESSVPPDTYSTGLHIIDSSGNLAAQVDTGLPGQGYHCQKADIHLPPGSYTVYALVYNWQTGERMAAMNGESGEEEDRVEVGRIEIP